MKVIEIKIARDGDTTIKTFGYSGTECRDATKNIEKALGLVTKDEATADLYSPPTILQERIYQ